MDQDGLPIMRFSLEKTQGGFKKHLSAMKSPPDQVCMYLCMYVWYIVCTKDLVYVKFIPT